MIITYHKKFDKARKKLPLHQKLAVDETIALFQKDPHQSILQNHKLIGPMKGKRAMSAGFDLRIIFQEMDNYIVVNMLDVGSHDRMY